MCGHVLGLPACHPQTRELRADWLTWVLLSHGGRKPEDKEGSRGAKTSWGPEASPRGRVLLGLLHSFVITLFNQRPTVCQEESPHTITLAGRLTGYKQLCLVLEQTLKYSRASITCSPLSETCQITAPLSAIPSSVVPGHSG